jgi:hypothetical protein
MPCRWPPCLLPTNCPPTPVSCPSTWPESSTLGPPCPNRSRPPSWPSWKPPRPSPRHGRGSLSRNLGTPKARRFRDTLGGWGLTKPPITTGVIAPPEAPKTRKRSGSPLRPRPSRARSSGAIRPQTVTWRTAPGRGAAAYPVIGGCGPENSTLDRRDIRCDN